jgi:hypothetical protein
MIDAARGKLAFNHGVAGREPSGNAQQIERAVAHGAHG